MIAKIDDLELRTFGEEDADHVAAMEAGDLTYAQGEWLTAPGQHVAVVSQIARANREGTSVFCGIWRASQFVGFAGLQNIDRWNQTASLDYGIAARFRGQGIATRACAALIDYGFPPLIQENAHIVVAGISRNEIEGSVTVEVGDRDETGIRTRCEEEGRLGMFRRHFRGVR